MKSNFEFLNSRFPVLANFGELWTNDPAEGIGGRAAKNYF